MIPSASLRFLRFALAASLALVFASTAAHASLLFSETFTPVDTNGQLTGSITLNFSTFVATGSYTYFDGTTNHIFNAADLVNFGGEGESPDGYTALSFEDANDNILYVAFHTYFYDTDEETYGYAQLCSVANPCSYESTNNITGGFGTVENEGQSLATGNMFVTVQPFSATPEPSSLALLGTGVLGIAGATRRRFRRA